MMVDLTSIIQIRDENSGDEENLNKYEFWSDLPTIFKRGLQQKRLTNCTRKGDLYQTFIYLHFGYLH